MARPSLFKPEYVKQAEKLCALGATDVEIADFFSVSVATVSNWKNAHPEFLEALKTGKEALDERVERSLYHRAIGYTFDAVKIFPPKGDGEAVKVAYREHVPPDTTAMIFWLKNRRPQKWRDVHKHEHGEPGEFDDVTDAAELRRRLIAEAEEIGARDIASAITGEPGSASGSRRPH